ncbi:MAG TPA: hypothetical protein VMB91_12510 [Solirubrobacteraceae bacterium]|nr:hypothetical protein [Solirubrobacteraceae bacterium]
MITVVLAASYLSASLLSMLVPIATVSAIVAWGVVLLRRHEHGRQDLEAGQRPPPAPPAAEGSHSILGR